MIKAVILAGGSGTRLWPTSRAAYPKQFLSLYGKETMLQATLKRLSNLDIESSVVICNEDHRFFVAEQLREINALDSIILEPIPKNTAPAIALAAFASKEESMLLVLPADHVIKDISAFSKAVSDAIPIAESGKLVTFGINPDKPNTGYGYIKSGKKYQDGFIVDEFVEKPSLELAKKYVDSGDYFWNSGMFLFKSKRYLEELQKFCPDIYTACKLASEKVENDLDFTRISEEEFKNCPSKSIDYAVMEKTSDAILVPMSAGWNDIGSWSSLWEINSKDKNGNSIQGDVITYGTSNSLIQSDGKLVATLGIKDLIIISTKDVVLVANKDNVEDIKIIANQLKIEERAEWQFHREVYRPWGKYDSIDIGEGYQVKRITVNPGAKLSVQKHHHRAEHWVVVSGTARVTNGDETLLLKKNESTYIPLGTIHALENPSTEKLELIEVQSGDYLGEDDIVRFEDIYGRISDK